MKKKSKHIQTGDIKLDGFTAAIVSPIVGIFFVSIVNKLSNCYNYYFTAVWFIIFTIAAYAKLDADRVLKKRIKFLEFIR